MDPAGVSSDPDRRRVVVGRDFPFLKKGTVTSSEVDILVSEQQECSPTKPPFADFNQQ